MTRSSLHRCLQRRGISRLPEIEGEKPAKKVFKSSLLSDNGIQFRYAPRYANSPTARFAPHMFDMRCREHGIEHRFTQINHPWTNGQVERMNRTIKEATVKRYHDETHDQLQKHLDNFVDASTSVVASKR